MNKILFVLLALTLSTACSTTYVKLSPEEIETLFVNRPDFNKARFSGYKVRAQHLDPKTGAWTEITCLGEKCWKSPLENPPEVLAPKPAENLALAKANCENTAKYAAVRRNSCYDYVRQLNTQTEKVSSTESVRIIKMMCDLEGVSCKFNDAKFGNGFIGEFAKHNSLSSGTLKIKSAGSKSVVSVYDYIVLREEI